jgi:hypothetical protein
VNHDGLLDLLRRLRDQPRRWAWPPGTPNFQLYLNNGDGTFIDVGPGSGIQLSGMVKAAVWGDVDNDGWPDSLRLDARRSEPPVPKPRELEAVGRDVQRRHRAGRVAEPKISFTTWFFDYDNDGWLDIFVTGYSATLPNIVREVLGQKDQAIGESGPASTATTVWDLHRRLEAGRPGSAAPDDGRQLW